MQTLMDFKNNFNDKLQLEVIFIWKSEKCTFMFWALTARAVCSSIINPTYQI